MNGIQLILVLVSFGIVNQAKGTWTDKLTDLLTSSLLLLFVSLFFRWDLVSVYSRYLVLLLMTGNWVWVCITERYLIRLHLPVLRISKYLMLVLFGFLNVILIRGCFIPPEDVGADFPSPFGQGKYYVVQGGRPPLMNRGHFLNNKQDKYSVDFVRLSHLGFSKNNCSPKEITHYHIYKDSLFCPCHGMVLEVRQEVDCNTGLTNSVRDRNVRRYNNIVVIQYQDAELIFAHLKKGTIAVEKGQQVKPFDFIGQISNPGAVEPHLHMQLIKNGKPVPFTVDGRFLHNNSILRSNN
jgi:hypothetical protein